MELNARALHLLQVLVETHVNDASPVGSKLLAERSGLQLSAATVRNVMSELEEKGYIASPHTSAGRVPTESGYRAYVDALLTRQRGDGFNRELGRVLGERLQAEGSASDLVRQASSALAEMTQMAGLVVIPFRESLSLQQIEFLPLAERRVLAVLVMSNQEVQNRVFETERVYSPEELRSAAAYITATYQGNSLAGVRAELIGNMQADKDELDQTMQSVLDLASRSLGSAGADKDMVVSGEARLLSLLDASNVERLQGLFEAFNRKRDILHLLEHCEAATGIQIFIGSESRYAPLNDCSVVSAPYGDEEPLGVLAVIGPTRMDYRKVISTVDVTAKLLGGALNRR